MPEYKIRRGMTVYGADNRSLGTVDDVTDTYFTVRGQQYPLNSGYRVENNYVYLTGGRNYAGNNQNEMRVPVREEQLNVDKRQAQLGEVQVHKTVDQEKVNVPVELRREEVNVEQRDVNDLVGAGLAQRHAVAQAHQESDHAVDPQQVLLSRFGRAGLVVDGRFEAHGTHSPPCLGPVSKRAKPELRP